MISPKKPKLLIAPKNIKKTDLLYKLWKLEQKEKRFDCVLQYPKSEKGECGKVPHSCCCLCKRRPFIYYSNHVGYASRPLVQTDLEMKTQLSVVCCLSSLCWCGWMICKCTCIDIFTCSVDGVGEGCCKNYCDLNFVKDCCFCLHGCGKCCNPFV